MKPPVELWQKTLVTLAARRRQVNRAMIWRALLVGVLAGLAGVAFRLSLQGAAALRERAMEVAALGGHGASAAAVIGLAGVCVLSVWLVRRFAPEAAGSGIPHVKQVLAGRKTFREMRVLLVKFFSGTLSIGAGMTLGREGPTVQLGAACGQMVVHRMPSGTGKDASLVAAGAGAGLTAAFNAPLAGTVFVLEELHQAISGASFLTAAVACIVADLVTRSCLGVDPIFPTVSWDLHPLHVLGGFTLVGLVAGLLGSVFGRALLVVLDWTDRARPVARWTVVTLVSLAVAVLCLADPGAAGGGESLARGLISGATPILPVLLALLLLRTTLLLACYGTGAAGGLFAPLLVIGGLLGLLCGKAWLHVFSLDASLLPVFALVGMAAVMGGAIRAPLTGAVLMIELTYDYRLVLPFLIGSFAAFAVGEVLRTPPLYDALAARSLPKPASTASA